MKRILVIPPGRGSLGPSSGRPYFPVPGEEIEWKPAIDVYETEDAAVVVVDLAGIEPDSVDVTVQGRVLRVRGVRHPPLRPGHRQFHRLEIGRGWFERVVDLPGPVESERTEAAYRNGLLEVILPFRAPTRPTVTSEPTRRRSETHD